MKMNIPLYVFFPLILLFFSSETIAVTKTIELSSSSSEYDFKWEGDGISVGWFPRFDSSDKGSLYNRPKFTGGTIEVFVKDQDFGSSKDSVFTINIRSSLKTGSLSMFKEYTKSKNDYYHHYSSKSGPESFIIDEISIPLYEYSFRPTKAGLYEEYLKSTVILSANLPPWTEEWAEDAWDSAQKNADRENKQLLTGILSILITSFFLYKYGRSMCLVIRRGGRKIGLKLELRKVAKDNRRIARIAEEAAIVKTIHDEMGSVNDESELSELRTRIAQAIKEDRMADAEHLIGLAERLSKLKI